MQNNGPIPLIHLEGDQFKITPQAISFLKQIKGPVGVVSIVGKYRTGKSLFLNKVLLKSNSSFKVCPTINSCTKGLWLSRSVIKSQHPDCNNMDVIVIDTQGFGAMQETEMYNNRIILFALLLSSYFIYNSVGSIDEKSLNNINVITNLAKELQSKNLSNDKIQEQFPTFMWVVRDFTLKLVNTNGDQMDAKQYLEYALEIQKGVSDAVENKNKIRRMMKHFFKERDCFTLVTPVLNEDDLQRLNTLSDSEIRPQFLEQINQLRQKIVRRVKPKKIKNRKLTGETFIELANYYVDAMNSGVLPNIDSAWKSINNFQINQTVESAKNSVKKQCSLFNENIKKQQEFLEFQKNLMNETVNFMRKKITNDNDFQLHFANLKQFIVHSVAESKQKNKKSSLQILLKKFHQECQQFGYEDSSQEILNKWIKLQKFYRQKYQDNPSLNQFLLDRLIPMKFESLNSLISKQNNLIRAEENQKKMIKETLEKRIRDEQQKNREMQNELYQVERNLQYFKVKSEEQQKIKAIQITYIQKDLKQQKEDLQKYQYKNETLVCELKHKEAEITELRVKNSTLLSEFRQSQDDRKYIQKQLQILKETLNYKVKQIQELKQANLQAKIKLQKSQDKNAHTLNKINSEYQNKLHDYQNLLSKYENSQKQITQLNEQLNKVGYTLEGEQNRMSKQSKIYESMLHTLKNNYDNEKQHTVQLIEANKNMAFALKHLQQRFQQVEQRQKKLKQFKKCFKNSSCMQCQNCTKFFVPAIFPQHLNVCIVGSENLRKLQSESQRCNVSKTEIIVKQTLLKDSDSKPYTQYVLQVRKDDRKWSVTRKYKQFCDLHAQLKALLPGVNLSIHSFIVNPQEGTKKSLLVEERRKILQKYLNDIAQNPHISEQPIWKQFIQDQNMTEENTLTQNSKLAISHLLRAKNQDQQFEDSQQKQNILQNSRNYNHKTPQQFLKIWNQRNLRAKQISKTKKIKY